MPKIVILDEITANQIAAGEVVERPVSVVKELVENSLDAGATSVEVDIYEGGMKKITVIDNGIGMSPEDTALAFNRHATSKIKNAADLVNIRTLGFRGEALPSIAAVSKIILKTKPKDCVSGTRVELSAGKILSTTEVGCAPGSSVTVKDLFFNTPARLKHMKTAFYEAGRITDLINRLAMAKPEVSFRLCHNKKVVFHTPGSGKLLDAVSAVYGINNVRDMISIVGESSLITLSGYISKPTLNRANRKQQTIFINNRLVKSNLFLRAIEEAYRTLLPGGRYPLVVLSLHINPEMVDVNVHPSKLEVRVEQEEEIARFIKEAILKELQSNTLVPRLELSPPIHKLKFNEPKPYQESLSLEFGSVIYNRNEEDSKTKPPKLPNEETRHKEVEAIKIVSENKNYSVPNKPEVLHEITPSYNKQNITFPVLWPVAQLMPTYILATNETGLYIIDQHAAHERVLFEKYERKLTEGRTSSQMLLVPVTLDLDFREAESLNRHIIVLKELGFIVEEFGGDSFILRGVPENVSPGQEKDLFLEVLTFVEEPKSGRELIIQRLAAAMACKAAIKSGEKLTLTAMQALIKQLGETENPYTCPHGRPTLIHLSYNELAGKFKR
ncbi:DNA mismatch repair endonuclease MutL [Desulfolucanica intricata]|uniref:DNA mismatch repair endonuclease MutL n=1 Tax=Desulfolucanica intricata TaxID=1285191 RepID=UPI0008300E05|nr:DNA mismatch repair endonuclease MutL [Desulfolucanica intricata]